MILLKYFVVQCVSFLCYVRYYLLFEGLYHGSRTYDLFFPVILKSKKEAILFCCCSIDYEEYCHLLTPTPP